MKCQKKTNWNSPHTWPPVETKYQSCLPRRDQVTHTQKLTKDVKLRRTTTWYRDLSTSRGDTVILLAAAASISEAGAPALEPAWLRVVTMLSHRSLEFARLLPKSLADATERAESRCRARSCASRCTFCCLENNSSPHVRLSPPPARSSDAMHCYPGRCVQRASGSTLQAAATTHQAAGLAPILPLIEQSSHPPPPPADAPQRRRRPLRSSAGPSPR